MDKKKILDQLIGNVKDEMQKAKEAFESTKEFASEEDMQAESKWDTRSTEAKFLASGQQKRLEELKLELQMLEEVELPPDNETVSIGSLVEIEFNDQDRSYFISPTAGGTMLSIDGHNVLVISVFSPIGSEAIGLGEGDEFEVETPKENRTYIIKKIS